MEPTATDAELIERWRDGDTTAANELVTRHFAAVARVFRFKADDALDDLVQQTFLTCVENRDRIIDDDRFRPWLLGVAYNLLRRYFEQRVGPRGRVDPMTTSMGELDARSPSGWVAMATAQTNVLSALRSVPLEFQLALELFYWEELTAAQIGDVLGIPEGTVRSRLRIGRDRVRAALQRLEPDGPHGPHGDATDLEARTRGLR